jgi:hypothetical protein
MTYKINNISPTQCQTALKLFFGIAEEWRLTNEQCCALLGIKSESTMRSWHKRVQANEDISLSTDTIERLSLIAGIYKGIQKIFDDPDQWRDWIQKPNMEFDGQSALDRMLAGNISDLKGVRRYLDYWGVQDH